MAVLKRAGDRSASWVAVPFSPESGVDFSLGLADFNMLPTDSALREVLTALYASDIEMGNALAEAGFIVSPMAVGQNTALSWNYARVDGRPSVRITGSSTLTLWVTVKVSIKYSASR